MTCPKILLFALLLVACAPTRISADRYPPPSAPPEAIWQEGPAGWVYGRSPLHLWPSGFQNSEITRLPDRVVFDESAATLDRNGMQVALLQAQRLRQLPNHWITLFCGWSDAEARVLDATKLQVLAADRCDAIVQVYRAQGLRLAQIDQRLVGPAAGLSDDLQRSVRITVVASGQGRGVVHRPETIPNNPMLGQRHGVLDFGRYDYRQYLHLPEVVYFDWGSAELDANARALLRTFADWIYPDSGFAMFLNCDQLRGERPHDEHERGLARDRCEAVRTFLVARGLCQERLIHGTGGRVLSTPLPDPEKDEQSLGAWMDQVRARPADEPLGTRTCPLGGFWPD